MSDLKEQIEHTEVLIANTHKALVAIQADTPYLRDCLDGAEDALAHAMRQLRNMKRALTRRG